MPDFTIEAKLRKLNIKSPSRKANRSKQLIGIIYNKKVNLPITLDLVDFEKIHQQLKSNSVVKIILNQKEEHQVLLRSESYFLKSNQLQHLDFYKITPKQKIKIYIPIELTGRSVGVVKGGVIRRFADRLLVLCTPESIPEKIQIDISKLEISDFLHLKDIPSPKGTQFLESVDKAVVAISTTSKSRSASKKEESEQKADSQVEAASPTPS